MLNALLKLFLITSQMTMQKIIQTVEKSLLAGKGIRRRLPGGGSLQIDRPMPIILVYRRRKDFADQATDKLLAHASSALIAGKGEDVDDLVKMIAHRGAEAFGRFLILEIWSGPEPKPGQPPGFVIYGPKRAALIPLVDSLHRLLSGIELEGRSTEVVIHRGLAPAPPGCTPLMSESEARERNCIRFGLEIQPFYRDMATGDPWPQILRNLRRDLTQALRRWVYRFSHDWTSLRPLTTMSSARRPFPPRSGRPTNNSLPGRYFRLPAAGHSGKHSRGVAEFQGVEIPGNSGTAVPSNAGRADLAKTTLVRGADRKDR